MVLVRRGGGVRVVGGGVFVLAPGLPDGPECKDVGGEGRGMVGGCEKAGEGGWGGEEGVVDLGA